MTEKILLTGISPDLLAALDAEAARTNQPRTKTIIAILEASLLQRPKPTGLVLVEMNDEAYTCPECGKFPAQYPGLRFYLRLHKTGMEKFPVCETCA